MLQPHDISREPCVPNFGLVKSTGEPKLSALKGTCAYCGVTSDLGMEEHVATITSKEKGARRTKLLLCPICHMCQHLQVAGVERAGILIWVPEISQAEVNAIFCSIFAVAAQKKSMLAAAAPSGAEYQAYLDQSVRRLGEFFSILERIRARPVATQFGEAGTLLSTNDPAFLAQELETLSRRMPAAEISERTKGLHFLATPTKFARFVVAASRTIAIKRPLDSWLRDGDQLVRDGKLSA